MKKLLAVLLLISFASGCATQTFRLQKQRDPELSEERMQLFVIGGIGQTQTIDAAEVCDGAINVVKVESTQTFLDGLIGSISGGIITPRTVRVYCTD